MNYTFINKIKNVKANPAVTIIMNTHRTFPENSKDSINLKNLISDTEKRILNEYGETNSKKILNNLKEFVSNFDHNYNLDSLMIFVSSDFLEFIRLPVKVIDSVFIDNKFATKVLIRSMLQIQNYYILCISRKMIRLIEAANESVVNEIKNDNFPIINDSYLESDDIRKAWANVHDNYAKEFFHIGDKLFNEYSNKNPNPVILAGDVRNISYYKEIANNINIIIGHIEGNYDETKVHEIVKQAYSVVLNYVSHKQEKALEELDAAKKEKKLLTDINDIYAAAKEGRGLKLLAEKNYIQPAKIENSKIILKDNPSGSDINDDVINEIIELVINSKGNVMFMDINKLTEYNKIALIIRY